MKFLVIAGIAAGAFMSVYMGLTVSDFTLNDYAVGLFAIGMSTLLLFIFAAMVQARIEWAINAILNITGIAIVLLTLSFALANLDVRANVDIPFSIERSK